MKLIISGTNRGGSNTLKTCSLIQNLYDLEGEAVEIMDLRHIELEKMAAEPYGKSRPESLSAATQKINQSEGLILVVPEYNGSMPGILKYFIDHWDYPQSFEARPVCFIGLGGRFGGLRPVEHLQQVFSYRNSYIFPERVFLSNIWNTLKDGKLNDETAMGLLKSQVTNFRKFVKALQSQGLDANSRLKIS